MYLLNQVGEWNPQLFRELKGRFNPRNVLVTLTIALVGQILLCLYFASLLPVKATYNRYCTDNPCFQDFLGNWVTIPGLWWLDLFVTMSVGGIFLLLIGGCYLLIADISQEEKQGTLNFIRLSPATARNIFLGKILGVPSLLYWLGLLTMPLHIVSGLKAGIPPHLIGIYYLVLGASLACFYSLAILYTLVITELGGFQPWLGTGIIFFSLCILAFAVASEYFHPTGMVFDWLYIFYPGTILNYLVKYTYIAPGTIEYFDLRNLIELQWYNKPVFATVTSGTSLIILNYLIWTFWAWQGIKRRFHNPLATVITKPQSYWLTGSFMVMSLGFTLQDLYWRYSEIEHFAGLQVVNLVFCLILMVVLTPQRQTVQDWARYRHRQTANKRHLWSDLLLGEKSPPVVAIAANLGLITLYILPSVCFLLESYNRIPILIGWLITAQLIIIYSLIVQIMLQMKNKKRALWTTGVIAALIAVPIITMAVFGVETYELPLAWLFSILPTLGAAEVTFAPFILSCALQWLAIVSLTGVMTRNLHKVGASESKQLLSGN